MSGRPTAALNRALLVGINRYPGAPLSGCVNDVQDMAEYLVGSCGFSAAQIRVIVDDRATAAAIRERLAWLVRGLRAGDRILFHYSGHGAQVATRDPNGEPDGLDEVLCPQDFDWSEPLMIRDKEMHRIFSAIPSGVEAIWVSDSCHSASQNRDMVPPGRALKRLLPPADIAWRNRAARERGHKRVLARDENNMALVSGCRDDQTSADASFDDRPNGALTYFLLESLREMPGASLAAVVEDVNARLRKHGYDQEPQLSGPAAIGARAFLR